MGDAGIKVWGLDGSRGYFSDADGPAGLYANINALVAYNDSVPKTALCCCHPYTGWPTQGQLDSLARDLGYRFTMLSNHATEAVRRGRPVSLTADSS